MPTGALPAEIRVEVAWGATPDAASPIWTDISTYVDAQAGLSVRPGRSPESPNLAPRTLTLTVDNIDRRFDPANTSSPYYPGVRPLVPVRVRALVGTEWRPLFRGVVWGGWPQNRLSATSRKVNVEVVDPLGWAAGTEPPRTAYDGSIRQLTTVVGETCGLWIRPCVDGWRELQSRTHFRHSARMRAADGLVDGDDSWGDEDGTGVGTLAPLRSGMTPATPCLLTWWQRITAPPTSGQVGIVELVDPGVGRGFAVGEAAGSSRVAASFWTGPSARREVLTADVNVPPDSLLRAGAPVFVAVWFGPTTSDGGIWVDGVEQPVTVVSDSFGFSGGSRLRLNHLPRRWAGEVDHFKVWTGVSTRARAQTIVSALWEGGRVARAGDSLDERARWILHNSGWGLVSSTDRMSGVTRQGYRSAAILDLLRVIEETEQGLIWADSDGTVRLYGREWPSATPEARTPFIVFRDDGTALPFAPGTSALVEDDRLLVNSAQVTSEYGTAQTYEDAASIATYGRRHVHLSGLLHSTDRQSLALAEWLVRRRAYPTTRIQQITFSAALPPSSCLEAATLVRPGWMVELRHDGIDYRAHVVDVGHQITATTWDTTLVTTPTRLGDVDCFRWDDGSGTVGTPWDNTAGTQPGVKGWAL